MKGKRVQFDDETWAAVNLLARDRMQDFQELADEAFRDILRKYGRPTSLKEALRKSAGASADVVAFRPKAGANEKLGQAGAQASPARKKRVKAQAKRKVKRSKRR